MPCNEWNDAWVAQLYGELEPGEREQLERHLEGCSACRRTLDELAESRSMLQAHAPAVPSAPRVVVLQPRPVWPMAWTFAAGAAASILLFALGLFAGPHLLSPEPALQTAERTGTSSEPSAVPATDRELQEMRSALEAIQQRVASLEAGPPEPDATMNASQVQQQLDALEQRFQRARSRDLQYVMESISDSELRTGSWIDQTQDALNILALRQDPHIREQ